MILCAFFFSNCEHQNSQVSETKEFSRKFHLSRTTPNAFKSASAILWSYRGEIANPRWKDIDKGECRRYLTISPTDCNSLRQLFPTLSNRNGSIGPGYRVTCSNGTRRKILFVSLQGYTNVWPYGIDGTSGLERKCKSFPCH